MFKKVAVVVGIAIGALLLFATTRPDSFRVERSTLVTAPPEKIFGLINDFHQWTQWSPWENIDPQLERSYSGPASGTGSTYAWKGNDQVGSGRMEILESAPSSRILIKLDFIKPMEAHNQAEFTLQAEGSAATRVTWTMYGPSPYIAKLIGIFFSMDAMVGKDFEKGLAQLKSASER